MNDSGSAATLDGSVALVTGASSDVGETTALDLAGRGVGAFSESLRQEVTGRHVRVALIEPGAVETELAGHNRPEILERIRGRFGDVERLPAGDIADAIAYIVTRPRHVEINELLIRPTEKQG